MFWTIFGRFELVYIDGSYYMFLNIDLGSRLAPDVELMSNNWPLARKLVLSWLDFVATVVTNSDAT
jgi:hypothetical protein